MHSPSLRGQGWCSERAVGAMEGDCGHVPESVRSLMLPQLEQEPAQSKGFTSPIPRYPPGAGRVSCREQTQLRDSCTEPKMNFFRPLVKKPQVCLKEEDCCWVGTCKILYLCFLYDCLRFSKEWISKAAISRINHLYLRKASTVFHQKADKRKSRLESLKK